MPAGLPCSSRFNPRALPRIRAAPSRTAISPFPLNTTKCIHHGLRPEGKLVLVQPKLESPANRAGYAGNAHARMIPAAPTLRQPILVNLEIAKAAFIAHDVIGLDRRSLAQIALHPSRQRRARFRY